MSVTTASDLKELLDSVATLVNVKFGAALKAVGDAETAWTQSYLHHDQVLGEVAATERLRQEILLGAFLATVAGGGGGALAGFMKNVSTLKALGDLKTISGDIELNTIIDASKDGFKYVMRTLPKLGGIVGSLPEVPGDSASAPGDSAPVTRGDRAAQGDDPSTFLGKLLSQLGAEFAMLSRELARMQLAAADAIVVGSTEEFDEDPLAFVQGDTILDQFAEGLSSDPAVYLEKLWATWLENYSYVIIPIEQTIPADRPLRAPLPLGADAIVVDNVSGPLEQALSVEAQACGSTLTRWMAEYAEPLRIRLEEQVRQAEEAEVE